MELSKKDQPKIRNFLIQASSAKLLILTKVGLRLGMRNMIEFINSRLGCYSEGKKLEKIDSYGYIQFSGVI